MDYSTSYICIIIVSKYFASGLIWINVIRCYKYYIKDNNWIDMIISTKHNIGIVGISPGNPAMINPLDYA